MPRRHAAWKKTYYYIVGFDVRVHYVAFPQKTQRQKELLCVRADSADIQSDIFAEALNDIAQVHAICKNINTG